MGEKNWQIRNHWWIKLFQYNVLVQMYLKGGINICYDVTEPLNRHTVSDTECAQQINAERHEKCWECCYITTVGGQNLQLLTSELCTSGSDLNIKRVEEATNTTARKWRSIKWIDVGGKESSSASTKRGAPNWSSRWSVHFQMWDPSFWVGEERLLTQLLMLSNLKLVGWDGGLTNPTFGTESKST